MKKKKISKASRAFYIALSYLSPRWNTKLLFLKKFGRFPDLKNPKTLNEKILKLKLESYGQNEVVRKCADKYRVREYIESCELENCLTKLIAVYDKPSDIDWESLPESFAMKWNFGCGYNIICPSKKDLDIPATVKKLEKWGKEPFWAYFSELQYRNMEQKIIVEEYLGDPDGLPPEDYKFYLDLRKYGSARHSGFGLGFERCVMYLTGMSNIRDVIPFPRTVNNCEL